MSPLRLREIIVADVALWIVFTSLIFGCQPKKVEEKPTVMPEVVVVGVQPVPGKTTETTDQLCVLMNTQSKPLDERKRLAAQVISVQSRSGQEVTHDTNVCLQQAVDLLSKAG